MKTQIKQARMGRPPLFDGASVIATVRISKEQAEAIERASRKENKDKSQWMRDVFEAATAKIFAQLDGTTCEPLGLQPCPRSQNQRQ